MCSIKNKNLIHIKGMNTFIILMTDFATLSVADKLGRENVSMGRT